ncbi:hypothetical protein SASPL_101099 [Salvia splendens]|uniref:Elongin-C n=1 Tax=Salvia splendens TaxID=180675 RepID=A0A8X9ADP1_SALSN|nr:hypothetical protein SASPL_101099 [Salvia splendens]
MKKEDTVMLISAEGFEFVIERRRLWFLRRSAICSLLQVCRGFSETEHGKVTFPEISTTILEKICQYFYWSLQYASGLDMKSRYCLWLALRLCKSIPKALLSHGKETEFHIEPELTLELMMAANYLHT